MRRLIAVIALTLLPIGVGAQTISPNNHTIDKIQPDTAAYRELCKQKCFCGSFHEEPKCPRGYHAEMLPYVILTDPEQLCWDCMLDNPPTNTGSFKYLDWLGVSDTLLLDTIADTSWPFFSFDTVWGSVDLVVGPPPKTWNPYGDFNTVRITHDTAREYVVRVDTVARLYNGTGADTIQPHWKLDTTWAAKVAVYLTPDDLAQLIRLLRWHEFLGPDSTMVEPVPDGFSMQPIYRIPEPYMVRPDSTCQHRRAK